MTPKEIDTILGIYISPTFLVFILALTAAFMTARVSNRYRLSRFVVNPPLVFLSVTLIYAVFIGTFLIPV